MKTFYHVTKKSNLESIKKNGLIPKIGLLAMDANESIERIYLFNNVEDMDNALMNWLGIALEDYFGELEEFISLKIDLPDNFPIQRTQIYESYCYETIPSNYISFFREEWMNSF